LIKLFISYRRSDSLHAAQRVRMSLQDRFGEDAVFIDREIPPGKNWEQHLEEMLVASTGVVVMVGDEFLKQLRKHRDGPAELTDPLVWEIATALRLGKTIYPVLFGRIDMPDPARLPEAIRAMARYQAVFAREPAFDAAIGELIKSVAAAHGEPEARKAVHAPGGAGEVPAAAMSPVASVLAPLLLSAMGVLLLWWAGRLILWLADPGAAARPAESALWHGLRYGLCTALWGLGPYLAYWLVAQLRARARLPIFNLQGLLTVANLAGILVTGGSFLLLSTLPGWQLRPLGVFPAHPGPMHYALLALGLLTIVMVALGTAVSEPTVRSWVGARRSWGLRLINATSAAVGACGLWLAASLVHSLPDLGTLDPVPVVGYLMLCPLLSLLAVGWTWRPSLLGAGDRAWQIRSLFALVIGLVVLCTLALFAYGPMRLLAPGL
jgi:hypothetical protein